MPWKSSVLVVANQTADSDELVRALSGRAERAPTQFTLLLPAQPGVSRTDSAERLEEVLDRLRAGGLEAEGVVGDCNPVVAVKETWDPGRFDEILVSTLPTGASKWLQIDLPHQVERMTGVQVTHVVGTPRAASSPSA
jgi:hypothetical protein